MLDGFVGKAATSEDREKANKILSRLGLASELAPLLLVAIREAADLGKTIDAGEDKTAEVERIRREMQSYVGLAPGSREQNASIAAERERLAAEHLAATRLSEAATRAAGHLQHLRDWLPQLFGQPDWTAERDSQGRIASGGGRLGCTFCPTATQQAAGVLKVDPYVPDSWRALRRPEPAGPRRRFRSQPLSTSSAPTQLGR